MIQDNLFNRFLDISTGLSGEVISSLIVIGIICLFAIYTAIRAKFADPLKKPRGFLFFVESGVNFFDGLAENLMGRRFEGFGAIVMGVASYLFVAFIFGLTGLPAPMTNLAVPLSLGIVAFGFIHYTSMKYTGIKYFKRYVDPIPIFLPINLISMWAPLLSLTFRLFGNALAGWTLMSIVYWGLENLSNVLFSFVPGGAGAIILPPFITPILHLYFDLFSGFIQTTVFIFLFMIFVANEAPEEEIDNLSVKGGN